MSGRIRTIKPELLEDAVTAGITADAFRLYIGSLLVADDHGNLRADPRKLRGDVFWAHDDVTTEVVEFLLMELWLAGRDPSRPGLLYLYTARGQRYAHVRNWEKHQKIDRRGNPRLPKPDDAEATEYQPTGDHSSKPLASLATDLDHDLDLDHDQRPSVSPTGLSSTPNPPSQDETASTLFGSEPPPIAPEHEVFEHWVAAWKQVIGGVRTPRLDDKRRGKIRARLREKFTASDLKRAVDGIWASEWHVTNRHYDIGVACRDAANVEKFMAIAPEPASVGRSAWPAELDAAPEREYSPEEITAINLRLENALRPSAEVRNALATDPEQAGDPRLPKPFLGTGT